MARQAALLRAVNLGARRRVPMAALREVAEGLGYADVATLVQSGNVVLTTGDTPATTTRRLSRALGERFGFDVDVVVRTARQMAAVVAADPLAGVATDPRRLHVVFLDRRPPAAAVEGMEEADVGADAIRVRGREIYLWSPEGAQRSPALRELDRRRLRVVATARNWNTVVGLRDMLAG